MQDYPHHYKVVAAAGVDGDISVGSDRLDAIPCAAPAEFGGPGDKWSPETLLTAAVVSCFILTFRAIARTSKLSWRSLKCQVDGTLQRTEGTTKFTEFALRATLSVPQDTSEERALRLLQKAEENCLVTSSLNGSTHLEAEVLKVS
jgi:peroxiredoxin-like protein